MKLIDKDKLHLTYKQGAYIGHGMYDGEGYYVDGNEVANAPIIEAIPIEWINSYTTGLVFGDDYEDNADSIDYYIDCIKEMVRDWEKENE